MKEYNNQCLTIFESRILKPCKVNGFFEVGTATPGETYTLHIQPAGPLPPRRLEVTADGAGLVSFQVAASLIEWLQPYTWYYFLLLKNEIPQSFTNGGLSATAARVYLGACTTNDPLQIQFSTPNPCQTC